MFSIKTLQISFTQELQLFLDPGHFRPIDETLKKETSGKGVLEILDLKTSVDEESVL